jgi:hypothetical protein
MMFNKDPIDKILAGKKTMTSRDKKLYDVGETTNLMANRDYSKLSGKYIKFTKVYQKKLGDFTGVDANKEGFNSLNEFIDYWNRNLEPKNSWNPNIVVWVHEFAVI